MQLVFFVYDPTKNIRVKYEVFFFWDDMLVLKYASNVCGCFLGHYDHQRQTTKEPRSWAVVDPAGLGIESLPGYRLSWLRNFMVFLSSSW
jgi:hypothetical protein